MLSLHLYDERRYLRGEIPVPQGESFIGNTPSKCSQLKCGMIWFIHSNAQDACPSATIVFNIMILTCSSIGVLASCFLLIGIYQECRAMLVPWIFIMLLNTFVELSHSLYVIIFEQVCHINLELCPLFFIIIIVFRSSGKKSFPRLYLLQIFS